MSERGRRCLYKYIIQPKLNEILKWVQDGYSNVQIIKMLGVTASTFYLHLSKETEFKETIELGKKLLVSKLEAQITQNCFNRKIIEVNRKFEMVDQKDENGNIRLNKKGLPLRKKVLVSFDEKEKTVEASQPYVKFIIDRLEGRAKGEKESEINVNVGGVNDEVDKELSRRIDEISKEYNECCDELGEVDKEAKKKLSDDKSIENLKMIALKNPVLFGEIYIKPYIQKWNTKTANHHYHIIQNILDHKNSITHVPVEHAKSTWCSLVLPLWFLYNDRNTMGCIISKTARQAEGFMTAIKWHIEHNKLLKQDFPDIKPDYSRKWTEKQFFLLRDLKAQSKDPSLMAIGTGGALLGGRLDWVIGDDVLDLKNTGTHLMRDKTYQWWQQIVDSRVVESGKKILLGTLQNNEDLLCKLSMKHYQIQEKEIYDEMLNDDYFYINMKAIENNVPLWSDRWSIERIETKRRNLGSIAFNQVMQNDRKSRVGKSFNVDWITFYSKTELPKSGFNILIGFDPALSKDVKTAEEKKLDKCGLSVLFEDRSNSICYLVEDYEEYLQFPDQISLLKKFYYKYKNYNVKIKIGIESVYYQDALRQALFKDKLPVFPVSAKGSKDERLNIFSVDVENGRFRVEQNNVLFVNEFINYETGGRSPNILDSSNIALQLSKQEYTVSDEQRPIINAIRF